MTIDSMLREWGAGDKDCEGLIVTASGEKHPVYDDKTWPEKKWVVNEKEHTIKAMSKESVAENTTLEKAFGCMNWGLKAQIDSRFIGADADELQKAKAMLFNLKHLTQLQYIKATSTLHRPGWINFAKIMFTEFMGVLGLGAKGELDKLKKTIQEADKKLDIQIALKNILNGRDVDANLNQLRKLRPDLGTMGLSLLCDKDDRETILKAIDDQEKGKSNSPK